MEKMESKKRFPLSHSPDYGYEQYFCPKLHNTIARNHTLTLLSLDFEAAFTCNGKSERA
jgi:hypothetical protein